jgi:hypothetical protein
MAGSVPYTFFTNIRSIDLYGRMQGPLSAPSHPAPDWEWAARERAVPLTTLDSTGRGGGLNNRPIYYCSKLDSSISIALVSNKK